MEKRKKKYGRSLAMGCGEQARAAGLEKEHRDRGGIRDADRSRVSSDGHPNVRPAGHSPTLAGRVSEAICSLFSLPACRNHLDPVHYVMTSLLHQPLTRMVKTLLSIFL